MKINDYYMGLDIGTNSVGWAVTDPQYNILDYRRKAMWGIHLFDEGESAADRRMHRCARRRLNRRKQRIVLLRELMDEEICKVDPLFFERLDDSWLLKEDKRTNQSNSLFCDENFTDKEYHARFPTIYHLRRYLMDTNEKPDIRLVFLAIHHIIKYRGHFLFADITTGSEVPSFENMIEDYKDDLFKYNIELCPNDISLLKDTLTDRSLKISDKKKRIIDILGCNTNPEKEVATLLAGGKIKLSELFSDESLDKESISFNDSGVDDKMAELEDLLDPDYFNTLRMSRNIFDHSLLLSILKGYDTLSDSKIASYKKHRKDLSTLKSAVRTYIPDKYREIFKDRKTVTNYCSYSGVCGNGKPDKTCDQDTFCKYCLGLFKETGIELDERYSDMMLELTSSTFLPKQSSVENGVIPYSVHKKELEKILNNVFRFYPFLKNRSDDGFSVSEKILLLEKFRVPYYVGPLNDSSNRSWAVRKTDVRATPWNFNDVIDEDASAEKFIDNLTSYCTYMVGEKVLPKNSLLYSYFQLCNELNNIRINGEKMPVSLKARLIDDKFRGSENSKVNTKSIKSYLIEIGEISKTDDCEITGMDNNIKSSLRSECELKKILGDKIAKYRLCEDIIRTITIFGTDSKRIRLKLKADHSDDLTQDEIKALSKLRFDGWGRLSEKFLTGLYDTCKETGQNLNIIGMLENTQDNLMEIYHKYNFNKQVEAYNRSQTSDVEVDYSLVDRMYLSPAVKRSVWRTVRVVKDILDVAGHPPKKVFVETTRDIATDKKGKRIDSRKEKLIQLYKACKEDPAWIDSLEKREDADLKSRDLYLYYTQLGRCMYCGKRIEIEDLGNSEITNRDHIYPQSKIKDDSIHNNMVLTCASCNAKKKDKYPLTYECRKDRMPFWNELLKKNYITSEKYSRLVRTDGFTDDELDKFISRQLVETSQTVKCVRDILGRLFRDQTDIVSVKSGLVSEFRQQYKMIKCRSVNDHHHAKDAYLNIVVGNVYDVKFTKDVKSFLKSHEHYNIAKMYDNIISRNGVTAWIPEKDGTIATVSKYMRRDNILFTKYAYVKKGQLYDDNLLKKKGTLFQRKDGMDPGKYGGYDNIRIACYALVEYTLKNKKVRSFEALPVKLFSKSVNVESIKKYLTESLEQSVDVIIPVVKLNTLLDWNGFRINVGGKTGSRVIYYPAVQLLIPDQWYEYSKKIYKCIEERKNRVFRPISYYSLDVENNVLMYDYLISKTMTDKYRSMMDVLHRNLVDVRDKFVNATPEIQVEVLDSIMHSFQCNATSTDLGKIKGVKTGKLIMNKKLPDSKTPVYLINQSVTGLNESKTQINLI